MVSYPRRPEFLWTLLPDMRFSQETCWWFLCRLPVPFNDTNLDVFEHWTLFVGLLKRRCWYFTMSILYSVNTLQCWYFSCVDTSHRCIIYSVDNIYIADALHMLIPYSVNTSCCWCLRCVDTLQFCCFTEYAVDGCWKSKWCNWWHFNPSPWPGTWRTS
jgi:hypothetical protein